jgi:hypothetical protein
MGADGPFPDRDRAAERQDRAADQRDEDGVAPDDLAVERDRAGGARDELAREREQTAAERVTGALQRDWAATTRDQAAASRDRAAGRGDRPTDAGQWDVYEQAMIDREINASDRRLAAEDRALAAAQDRTATVADRGEGAEERAAAVEDREAAAQDRDAAAHDRSRAAADREQAAVQRAQRDPDDPADHLLQQSQWLIQGVGGAAQEASQAAATLVGQFVEAKQRELAAHRATARVHEQMAELEERLGHPDRAAEARDHAEHAWELHRLAGAELAEYQARIRAVTEKRHATKRIGMATLGLWIDEAETFHMDALGRPGEGVLQVPRVEHDDSAVEAIVERHPGVAGS